jgi:hypothetical protein
LVDQELAVVFYDMTTIRTGAVDIKNSNLNHQMSLL